MTTQDVIEILEEYSPDDTSELGEAIAFALMILEKDIAQKPLREPYSFICPICKTRVFAEENYCNDCGQRLTWSSLLFPNKGKQIENDQNMDVDMSNATDFTAVVSGPNMFVGYLGVNTDGKVELAKKEIIAGFNINKGRLK